MTPTEWGELPHHQRRFMEEAYNEHNRRLEEETGG